MRSILAGTVGLSLGLGGLMAQSPAQPQPPASAALGRPIPAASLGRPSAMTPAPEYQRASFRDNKPIAGAPLPGESAPLLAPVLTSPISEDLPPPRPLPTDGGPGTTVTAPPPTAGGPTYGPGTTAPTGCDNCAGGYRPMLLGNGFPMFGAGYGFGGDPIRAYTSADFLLLWVPTLSTPLPNALVSTQPFNGQVLPPTQVAIGSTNLITDLRIGGRFGAGIWFDPCHRLGLDGSFFFAGPAQRDLVATTTAAFPTLLRPYIVINTPIPPNPPAPPGRPNFADIVGQNGNPGTVAVHTDSFLMGGDVSFRRQILGCCNNTLDGLLGFRYMHLDEAITINETGTDGVAVFTLTDRFRTINNFYGIQLGAIAHKQWGLWSADMIMKLGVGTVSSIVEVSGNNNFAANPNIGLFAQDSNIGRYRSNNFSIVPEVGLNIGYQITPRLRAHIGYTGIVWTNVLRPGDQMDPIIDETKVPKPGNPAQVFQPLHPSDPHPVIPFHRSDYYAHGIAFGLTLKW